MILYLFFVDGLILFAETTLSEADIVKYFLNRFARTSSHGVSFAKLQIYLSLNIREKEAMELCSLAGMPQLIDIGRYLGVRLIHQRPNNVIHAYSLVKFNKILTNGKSKCLSLAGRIALVRFVINSLTICLMQTAKLLVLIIKETIKRMRRFAWGGNEHTENSLD